MTPPPPEAYRCGPLIRFPMGAGQEAIYFPLAGVSRCVSTFEARVLAGWTSFCSVQKLIADCSSASPCQTQDALRLLFCDLRDRGCLVPHSALTNARVT